MRTLKAGTKICLVGSQLPLTLPADTEVEFPMPDTDEAFVGRLIRDDENFKLNIGSVEGIWSPVTGAREVEEEKRQKDEHAAAQAEAEKAERAEIAAQNKAPRKRSKSAKK